MRPSSKVRLRSPITPLVPNELFAVDDRSAQVFVRPETGNVARLRCGERVVEQETARGAAVITVDGLAADTPFTIHVLDQNDRIVDAIDGRTRPRFEPTTKFATVSDVHLGSEGFGPLCQGDHGDDKVPYPVRCLRGALTEAIAWGAEAIVIKGDLTDHGYSHEWEEAAEELADLPVPVLVTPGNHDVYKSREVEAPRAIRDLPLNYEPVQYLDLDSVRIVLADTSLPSKGTGKLSTVAEPIAAAFETDSAVWLGLHHNIQRTPLPWFWPAGISSIDANPVLRQLAELQPSAFISSGHTHRNRVHNLNGLTYTEVAATSDFPGVWAGYEVGPTMMRQTVRRIAAPDAVEWTEGTRAFFGTFWGRWSQGRLDDRCVDLPL